MSRYAWLFSVLLFVSCSTRTDAPQLAVAPVTALAGLGASLPFPTPADDRRTAVATPVTISGSQDLVCSVGASDGGETKTLPSGPGETEWAYYRLPTNGYPVLGIEIDLVMLVGLAYIGLANYTRGCWEFGPAVTEPYVVLGLGSEHLSPVGNVYVVVLAYNGAAITVVSVAIVLDQPGWLVTDVYSGSHFMGEVQLFSDGPDGLPHIASIDDAPGVVRLMRATTANPADVGDWDALVVDVGSDEAPLHEPLDAEFIDGTPAVVYYLEPEDSQWQPCYAYATTASPDSGDWVKVDVGDPTLHGGQQLSLCEYQGAPSIAVEHYVDGIWLVRSSDSTPSAADWAESRIAFDAGRPAIAVVGDLLAVSYFSGDSNPVHAGYARAYTATPSGPSFWNKHELGPLLDTDFWGTTALIATQSDLLPVPLMLVVFSNNRYPLFFCSAVTRPEATDWWVSSTDVGSDVGAAAADLCLVGGLPAAAYFLKDRGCVQLALSDVSAPADDADWQVTTIESGVDVSDLSLAEVNGAPALAYYDMTSDTLKYAYPD